ncbi:TRAM protein transporter [Encephalitozoon hellem ATCC 50504]|uniref:TLC domain-containing protein n=1 Tax=Encephalitozoon hellem TaxID=27973 RepID=A0A9Q9C762_ENCHE|nr:TRAM protein transporter [Encephalitozoon hellem ATCC 50504]AFM98834.1 TRAM protein transporter [Encephalitozoon hellem ATCC 50504]UTX43812.1 TLC domain-containing protein [Encephalitozoon hellem]|eukprot:XP_003887815.1 TRAM protein transporter [Encephalitozoon hellem ATCC 50504]
MVGLPDMTICSERVFESHIELQRDVFFVSVICLLIIMIKNLVILPLASILIRRFGMEETLGFDRKKKFCVSLWKAMFYSFTSVYGYFVIRSEPSAYTAKSLSSTWGAHNTPARVLFYYYLEFSYYFVELFYLFNEHMYKDFLQMVTHHVVTIMLLVLSYHKDMLRPGVVIMAIHDISDPFLEISKIATYVHYKSLAKGIFSCFAGIFIVSRLVIYAFLISLPIGISVWRYRFNPCLFLISILLQGLTAMHIIWSFMIMKMVIKVSRREEFEDIRSVKSKGSYGKAKSK